MDTDSMNVNPEDPPPDQARPGGAARAETPNRAARPGSAARADAPRTKHTERSEATRAALVAAARPLFAERGFAGVGTEEIVRAAGVTRGALYHHFSGKDGLFLAVFEQVERELTERIARGALAGSDPVEALQAGAE